MSGKDPIAHQAGVDYGQALIIARHYWPEGADDAVIQAATATVLIHLKDLRKNNPAVVSFAPQAGQTRAVGTARPAPTSAPGGWPKKPDGPTPKCPACGGDVWDNRTNKRNPKAPDYKCKDKNCLDSAGRVTGFWAPKEQNTNYAEQNRNPQSFARNPIPPDDEFDPDLPF